jgi:hypothetical protein
MYNNLQEAIDAGYHYFLRSIHGDYTNSIWVKKETAVAALESINNSNNRSRFFTPLVLIADKDL